MNEFWEFIENNLQITYILILAIFVGIEVIKSIPAVLHTPLMSGANALSGVVIVGAILVMLHADPTDYVALSLGFVAVVLGVGPDRDPSFGALLFQERRRRDGRWV